MASNNKEAVKKWRLNTKIRMVEAMGGSCNICRYDKCLDALEFHHLDPSKKDFAFGKSRANPKRWIVLVEELRKCVLLCNRCHREVHAGLVEVPENYVRFYETYVEYRQEKICETEPCPVCTKQKPLYNTTCSRECAAKLNGKISWDKIDLKKMFDDGLNCSEIGRLLNCSDVAVRKRAIKIGINF